MAYYELYEATKVDCRMCGGSVKFGQPIDKAKRCIGCNNKGWHQGVRGTNWHRMSFWHIFHFRVGRSHLYRPREDS